MGKIRLTESELISLVKRIVEDTIDNTQTEDEIIDDGIEDATPDIENAVSSYSQGVDFCTPDSAPERFVNNIKSKYPKLADKLSKVVETYKTMTDPAKALEELKGLIRDAKSKLRNKNVQREQSGAGLATALTVAGVTFTAGEIILVLGALYMLIYFFRCIKWRKRIKRGVWPPLPFSGGMKNRKCDGRKGIRTPMGRM